MSKIEELKLTLPDFYQQYNGHAIDRIMKEYAEFYAQKCLEVAATSAETMVQPNIQQGYAPYTETKVDPNSILNIKLPEHD